MEKALRHLTCIVCPKGCELTVTFGENGKIEKIEGYTCKRGEEYARTECVSPVRTVTSTVKTADGRTVAVKTSRPVPKELIFKVMEEINRAVVKDDISIGDTVIRGVCGTDADIIASSGVFG